MITARNGMGPWLEGKMETAQQELVKFIAKLHDDDGNVVRADVASFAFEWSSHEVVIMAETKVYASVLASYNKAKSDGKTVYEWVTFMDAHAKDQLMNLAQFIAGKSSLPSAHLSKDAEVQAWAKVVDALKWVKISLGDDQEFPIADDDETPQISPSTEKVYFKKPE